MTLNTKYGPCAAILGAESRYGKEFARRAAKRMLHVVLLSATTGATGALAAELARDRQVEVTSAAIGDSDIERVLRRAEVRLLICASGDVELVRRVASTFASRGDGGLVLVKQAAGIEQIAEELSSSGVDGMLLDPECVASSTLGQVEPDVAKAVDRCLGQLGRKEEYTPSMGDRVKASWKFSQQHHGAWWAAEMIPFTLLASIK